MGLGGSVPLQMCASGSPGAWLIGGRSSPAVARASNRLQGRTEVLSFPLGMAVGLNIKNDETCSLARDLARLTGETMTGAITVALRERLEREKRRRDLDARVEELLAIGRCCAETLEPGPSAIEHGDLLYDDQGLPE